jgi:hypothetical protein
LGATEQKFSDHGNMATAWICATPPSYRNILIRGHYYLHFQSISY